MDPRQVGMSKSWGLNTNVTDYTPFHPEWDISFSVLINH